MNCRHCGTPLSQTFLDLGYAPPSNDYLKAGQLHAPEQYYPLRLMVCETCWLVQTEDYAGAAELFRDDYAYFSSVSENWLRHAREYSRFIVQRLALGKDSFVVEVASNDGYLLRNFVEAGVPCLGIEPTESTAARAREIGVPTLGEFFGEAVALRLASEGKSADLIAGNNVFAHVPDINDFTRGLKALLKPEGTITLEFPHLLNMIQKVQFDTVYHEHFSYLSLYTANRIFRSCGLRIYDAQEISTHGGSLRIFACHENASIVDTEAVARILQQEQGAALRDLSVYKAFQYNVERVKDDLLLFLIEKKRAGMKVVGYGAAAKGVTLFNFSGVRADLVSFVCDAAPSKQGKYFPGCHIPILAPAAIVEAKPDFVLILPWNISEEVMRVNKEVASWGGKFVVAVPAVKVLT